MGDERLVLEAQRGNEAAFEVIYDRHHRGLLSFCRHMLRSREDAEDALQHTFASAHRALPATDRPVQLKPWLYTIARNRCLSMLRARRERPVEEVEPAGSTAGLAEEVDRRAELRELLADLEDLPERQRAALVLSELGDLDHASVAEVLDCETKQVKSLVFQARSALIENRRAREIPCAEIREQLATATAGELRRGPLRRHLRQCEGCAGFREEVRSQRRMLAVVLPVVPSLGLRESALAAAGIGGGGAAGGGGLLAALGASGVAKVAAVGVAATGAAGGLVAADPGLLPRAEAAVERAAGDVGRALLGSAAAGGEAARTARGGGSLNWAAAQRTAREKAQREGAGRGASSSPAARGPGGRAGNGRRGERDDPRGSSGRRSGAGGPGAGGGSRSSGNGLGRANGPGNARRGSGSRGRGPVGRTARGPRFDGGSPPRGRALGRRIAPPDTGVGRSARPRRLPSPGAGRGAGRGRALPKNGAVPPDRGKSSALGARASR